MNKLVKIITAAIFLSLSTGVVLAASLNVKISQPKSPTNQNTFNVNFVALDIDDRPVTVKCFKKGPSDGGFSQFGSDFNLIAGGNSDNCSVDSSVVNNQGTYQFFVRATAGSDTLDSAIVTVDYNTSGPGTPSDYVKEQVNSCTFKLKFKTANDGGKTVKVEFYRSDQTSFQANAGTVFASQAIGSNTNGEIQNTVPDCAKTYYYALRAFDNAGNGSGLVGDSFTTTTTTTSTTASPATAPVIVAASQISSGETTAEVTPSETPAAQTEGAATEAVSPTPQVEGAATSAWWADSRWRYLLVIAVLVLLGYGYKKYQSS